MAVDIPDAATLQGKKRRDWEAAVKVYFGERADLPSMVAAYIDGVGALDDFTLHTIRQKLNAAAQAAGLVEATASVVDPVGRLKLEFLQSVRGVATAVFYDIVPSDRLSSHVVLPESGNELSELEIPPAINMVTKMRTRPSVRLTSARNAELFLHPFAYQLVWREEGWFCPTASNRGLSKPALSRLMADAEPRQFDRDLVIIQDRFPGGNFAHFLFDWVTRIGLACDSGVVDPRQCMFVMGGTPGRFDQLVLDAVIAEYQLSAEQFLFPANALMLKTSARVLWFSDETEHYLHPAQVAHPQSVAILRKIGRRLPIQPGTTFLRLYVSRIDAGRRRVTNEPELLEALKPLGFETVVLSDHSVDRQLALIAGAEVIVAPHGMGLASLSLHPGTPALIELHHPATGTEAYALMATAMGFPYRFVLGEAVENGYDDYQVPVGAVIAAVTPHTGNAAVGPEPVKTPLIPDEQGLTANVQLIAADASDTVPRPVSPFDPSEAVWCHERADAQAVPDSNVGAMMQIGVDEGRFYTASCWVWIPQNFRGSAVRLSVGEWPNQWLKAADLSVRDQWQLITASKTSPPGVTRCNLVLRVMAPQGERLYSSHWTLEAGFASSANRAENRPWIFN